MSRGLGRSAAAIAVAVGAAATGCATEGPDARTIELRPERGFEPASISVRAGDTVVFDNRTTRISAVTGQDTDGTVQFDSDRLLPYGSWVVRLEQQGTYTFAAAGSDFIAVIEVTS